MFIERKEILKPEDVNPFDDRMEIVGAFNTGASIGPNGQVHYAVRVVHQPKEQPEGGRHSPRFENGALHLDFIDNSKIDHSVNDPRGIKLLNDTWRLPFISTNEIYESNDGFELNPKLHNKKPVRILPASKDQEFGIEDARVTRIEDTYYITATGVSEKNGSVTPQPNIISTKDFISFTPPKPVLGYPDKNMVLFPERINGEFVAFHRPDLPSGSSDIMVTHSDDLENWEGDSHLTLNGQPLAGHHRGPGAPPVRIDEGWLTITHKRSVNPTGETPFIYSAHAVLLDEKDPTKIIGAMKMPFMSPEEKYEVEGFFGNVVFPTGAIKLDENSLYVCYGAADESTGAAIVDLKELKSKITNIRNTYPAHGSANITSHYSIDDFSI